jgi:hypothetical protein
MVRTQKESELHDPAWPDRYVRLRRRPRDGNGRSRVPIRRVTLSRMMLFVHHAGRVLLLAVFLILSAGFAVAAFGNNYAARAHGAANGVSWWHCAVYGPPEWADGQR